jgi:pimeloyl-ACP methyl ester carboxylesterase
MLLPKRKIFRWLKVMLFVYATLGLLLYYFQEKILFHPVPLATTDSFSFTAPHNEINIAYNATTTFNVVEFYPTNSLPKKGVVIYFHGNKENVNRYAAFAENFTKNGYSVLMPDYPGFGKSIGTISEDILYEEALQVYTLAKSTVAADSIIIYGKSLGTALASYVASRKNCQQLILETPYKSMTSIFSRYGFMYPLNSMLHYKLPTIDYLKNVVAKVTIFQGTNDWVVPYSNAIELKIVMKPKDEFVTIEDAEHNNINSFGLYHQKLDSLLNK